MALPIFLPAPSEPSRFRTRIAHSRPAWSQAIAALGERPIDRATIDEMLRRERGDDWRDDTHLDAGLRRIRGQVFAALIDRDLDGRADVGEVMHTTTALAEAAIGAALAFHARRLAATHGVPFGGASGEPVDLLVVGMGKLGGGELNVSSDVDLIFVYGENGETRATAEFAQVRSLANEEFFGRLGRKLIATLAETTDDGFVFRVDMRLRPDGDAGPLVASLAMLERYLVTSARDWERFAWVKGRVVSPQVFAGAAAARELDALVVPFVYRRYLDFGAIDALRKLHGQIRDEAVRREAIRQGRSAGVAQTRIDVKLGRGGIREIEFIAQHFQLIRGGRDAGLRLRPTRAALACLVERRLIDPAVGDGLQEAYAFLRNVEHRLQYLDDAQTHTLPPGDAGDDCTRIAAMAARLLDDGAVGFDALVAAIERHRRFVEAQFDAIFVNETAVAPAGGIDLWSAFAEATPQDARDESVAATMLEQLAALGFAPPGDASARLVALARSARLRTLSAAARVRLDALVPRLIAASSGVVRPADANATLGRWFDLIEAIAGRSAYLALLDEYPAALRAVTRLLAASPWAAQYLTRHPLLLDELIDAPENDRPIRDATAWAVHWRAVATALESDLSRVASDAERLMDVLRETHHVETFRLLIDDLDGSLTIESLSDQLSALADLVLDAAIRHGWAHFVTGRADAATLPVEPAFAVIAYGKLGGKELGYASDLDLVFLYDERGDTEAAARYARFAQRLNVWLTARTTAGALFDIDLRLRPDGAAGLVVSSFDAWSRYERREHDVGAWTWEHQALTRARFAAGDRTLGVAFEAERVAILTSKAVDDADRARLRTEIVAMRARMHDGHPNRSGLFDLKHDTGGMVDIEFAVQYLVLAYAARHPALIENVGNIALLTRATDAGLLDAEEAMPVADAYRTYRARQHAIRLAEPGAHAARVAADACRDERAAVVRLWRTLFGEPAS
jgi:glutamate-ammonia-ligase adenylyltransferase